MGRRPTRVLAAVVALAAAFVAGWVAGRAADVGPVAPFAADGDVASAGPPRPLAPDLAAAPRLGPPAEPAVPAPNARPDVAPGLAPSSGSPVASASTTAAAILPAAWASLTVRVLRADGLPARGVLVRVRRAGTATTGTDEEETNPHRVADDEGRAVFAVLGTGPFDVDALLHPLEEVRAVGVRAADDRPTEVELRLPKMVEVVFRAEGLPAGATWQLMLQGAREPVGSGGAPAPWEYQGGTAGPTFRASLPEGAAVTARGWASLPPHGAVCDPFAVPAAAEVVVPFRPRRPPDRGATTRLTLRLAPEATEGTLPPRGSVIVDTLLELEGARRKSNQWTITWQPDDPDDRHDVTVEVPAGAKGSYRWQAGGGPPDEVALPDLPPGGSVVVRGRLRVAPATAVVSFDHVAVEDERGAAIVPSEAQSVWAFADTESAGAANAPDALDRLARELRTDALTLATDAWHVSRAVGAATSGPTRVRVALGGYLVVHVPRPPPPSAGALTLRRADGGWLGVRTTALPGPGEPGAPEDQALASVGNGTVVGPLPAGPIELVVSIGGADLGPVTATVVAGEVSVLTLR